MPRKYSTIVNIIDLEATCWQPRESKPAGQSSEIIEIGICTVDTATLEVDNKRSILLRPCFSTISPFCTELTGITQNILDEGGTSVEHAYEILKNDYQAKHRVWASWGDYDRKMFERQSHLFKDHHIKYPFGPRHLNIKNLFSLLYGVPKEMGMDKALAKMGLPLEGRHHRGHDDAWNIATIFVSLLRSFRKGEEIMTPDVIGCDDCEDMEGI